MSGQRVSRFERARRAVALALAHAMVGSMLVAAALLAPPGHLLPKAQAAAPGATERVSVASDGTQANYGSDFPSIAADGRYVAFDSSATNLVAGDTNDRTDVFVSDRQTDVTERVSVASDGTQANDASSVPSISADGRYVAFASYATNLVAGDTNNERDVFVRDRLTGVTERVSVASDGTQANSGSAIPSISADGRYVAFDSSATNLVAGDTNRTDVFVSDRLTGVTERVSVASDGTQANDASFVPSISADGRYVAFASMASNLVAGDTNNERDVFVRDRQTGTTHRVSVASDGTEANDISDPPFGPAISADGRYVAFVSYATNLVAGDTNNAADVFVRDRQTGTTHRVSVASGGTQANGASEGQSISADGRYVAFVSDASNLVAGDTNGYGDVFVRDRQTGGTSRVSVASDGTQGNQSSYSHLSISADGRYVAFFSFASNLVAGDTNGYGDVFVRDRSQSQYQPPEQSRGGGGHGNDPTRDREDPVNTATGEFSHSESDVSLAEPGAPLTFERHYSSGSQRSGALGQGWSHTYGDSLDLSEYAEEGVVTLVADDGQEVSFQAQADGSFTPLPGVLSDLAGDGDGFALTRKDLVIYHFDDTGRLLDIADPNGNTTTMTYDADGNLDLVTGPSGQTLDLAYDVDGHLVSVALPDGREAQYAYTSGNLTGSTNTAGETTTYVYDGPDSQMTAIIDANGNTAVENTYDASGRVVAQADPLGNVSTFTWDSETETSTVKDAEGDLLWVDQYAGNILRSETNGEGEMASYAYDADLNTADVTDPTGEIQMTWDADGHLLSRTFPPPLDYTESWTYDAAGNMTSFTDGRANTTTYTYDAAGNRTSEVLPDGATTTFTYTSTGNLLTRADPAGAVTSYVYDVRGNLVSETDPVGAATAYVYDAAGRRTQMTDARGAVTAWAYDDADRQLSVTDPAGAETTFEYDDVGNVTAEHGPLGRSTTTVYNSADEPVDVTDPAGGVRHFEYDSRGNKTLERSPTGSETRFEYDDANRMTARVDGNGKRWEYGYDTRGNRTAATDPLGNTTSWSYDILGRQLTQTDARGNTTTQTYDAAGNLASVTDAAGNTTSFTYDARNLRTGHLNPDGTTITFGYDLVGRLTSETDPTGAVTTYSYDAAGRLTSTVDPTGRTTSSTYDAVGNVVTEADGAGNLTAHTYDLRGIRTSTADPNGNATAWAYDLAGQLTTVTAADGAETTFTYDSLGQISRRSDATGHETTWTYDADGHMTAETNPLGDTQTWTYDGVGQTIQTQDRNGITTSRTYDGAGRLTKVDFGDGTPDIAFAYDAAGNRTRMTDAAGTVTYSYDVTNRPTSVSRGGRAYTYTYDSLGRVTQRVLPDGRTLAYTWDPAGRLATVGAGPAVTQYGYDAAGRLVATAQPNGTTETRGYDPAGRVVQIASPNGYSNYTLDPAGNPTRIDTERGTTAYGYDSRNQLISVCVGGNCGASPTVRYEYDGVGNRLRRICAEGTTTYTYNAADQLLSRAKGQTTVTYTYDKNGNMTKEGGRTYRYDAANRMIVVTRNGSAITFTYDGDGNRVSRKDGAGTTGFDWDINADLPLLTAETDSAARPIREYAYGAGLVSMAAAGEDHYYETDRLGTVTRLTDNTGAVEASYEYDEYGRTAEPDIPEGVDAPDNPMRYTGQYLDGETGYYNMRARQYDPIVGRFSRPDPLQPDPDKPYQSTYDYVTNRPMVMVDPRGERGETPQTVFLCATASCGSNPATGERMSTTMWSVHSWYTGCYRCGFDFLGAYKVRLLTRNYRDCNAIAGHYRRWEEKEFLGVPNITATLLDLAYWLSDAPVPLPIHGDHSGGDNVPTLYRTHYDNRNVGYVFNPDDLSPDGDAWSQMRDARNPTSKFPHGTVFWLTPRGIVTAEQGLLPGIEEMYGLRAYIKDM